MHTKKTRNRKPVPPKENISVNLLEGQLKELRTIVDADPDCNGNMSQFIRKLITDYLTERRKPTRTPQPIFLSVEDIQSIRTKKP